MPPNKPAVPDAATRSDAVKQLAGAKYFGHRPTDGAHRVKLADGTKMLLCGTAFNIVSRGEGHDKLVKKRVAISTSQGYLPNSQVDVSFLAVCKDTQKQIRLIGQVSPYAHERLATSQSHDLSKSESVQQKAKPSSAPAVANPTMDELAKKKRKRGLERLEKFELEISMLNAQSKAGLDPPVSIRTLCLMSNRAHATVYRDMKKGILPMPNKTGRTSSFPFSVAMAYANGRLN